MKRWLVILLMAGAFLIGGCGDAGEKICGSFGRWVGNIFDEVMGIHNAGPNMNFKDDTFRCGAFYGMGRADALYKIPHPPKFKSTDGRNIEMEQSCYDAGYEGKLESKKEEEK